MKFEVFKGKKGKKGKWYWRAKARNGNIVADGSQGYSTIQNARRAVTSFFKQIKGITGSSPTITSII